ncbi:MAG TPA: hypothetical protein VFD90_12785 [Gaiellales bacterium]|jgi:hypothetical protein|nr:hypothetical protein [Gaiellales bacterium]
MYKPPIAPQAMRGYPVDHDLLRANRAQRGPRRRFSAVRALAARLRPADGGSSVSPR